MDANHLSFALGRLGLEPKALEDMLRRGATYFATHAYTPEAGEAWCQALAKSDAYLFAARQTPPAAPQFLWEKLNMSQETFYSLPPAERIKLKREHEPEPPVDRRDPARLPQPQPQGA